MKKILLFAFAIIFAGLSYLVISSKMTIPFLYRYKAGYFYTLATIETKSPLLINKNELTELPWDLFDSHPQVKFMADPFVVEEKGGYYIFFEEDPTKMNSTGADLAVMHSRDLKSWSRLGVVLDEPFHLSYPNVFKIGSIWYMLPECGAAKEIRLYEATSFPMKWKLSAVLVKDIVQADPILIQKNGLFYILVQNNSDLSLRLYYSDKLTSGWKEHPMSPLRKGVNAYTRTGGTPGILNNKLIYFLQDHTEGYGTGIVAFQIDSLSPTIFEDHKLETNPILWKFGKSWAKDGMHQLSWIRLNNGQYFCVMDGAQINSTVWGWDWRNFPQYRW